MGLQPLEAWGSSRRGRLLRHHLGHGVVCERQRRHVQPDGLEPNGHVLDARPHVDKDLADARLPRLDALGGRLPLAERLLPQVHLLPAALPRAAARMPEVVHGRLGRRPLRRQRLETRLLSKPGGGLSCGVHRAAATST